MRNVVWALLFLLPFALAHGGGEEDGDVEISDEDARKLRNGKIALIVVIGFGTFLASCLPWYLRRLRHAVAIMHVLSCFAGGVMIGAALCHMFPDIAEAFKDYFEKAGTGGLIRPADAAYPFAYLIAGFVVIFLLAVDKALAHRWAHSHNHPSNEEGPIVVAAGDTADAVDGAVVVSVQAPGVMPPVIGLPDIDQERGKEKHMMDAYLFFIALSIHSIFDGLSVGAEQELHGFYALLIALVCHKALDGFALGVPVFYARLPLFHTLFALIFCASMTPLGIGIGWAATSSMNGAKAILARGIIVSISAGSFLFIAFIEMLPTALEEPNHLFLKITACFLGFGLMALIAIWV
eukprot:TRINITY_DN11_c0_g1_i1.p1 TRINITY_DN11_c0_g1~~TRINITY_DN11_c0_g1_i1.p1  ORF type:complete len:350 (-),score=48.48 TRINITY_DN11_c0_g1_i1:173-1222(-)